MNEEEKQAIDVIETVIRANRFDGLYTSISIIIEAMQTILKLMDKQQKEIEELKETEWKVVEIISDTNDNLEEMFIKLIKIFKTPKEKVKTNCISKDKIRELINKRNAGIGYTSLECIEDIEKLLEE